MIVLILGLILKLRVVYIRHGIAASWIFGDLVDERLNENVVLLGGTLHVEVLALIGQESLGHGGNLIHLIVRTSLILL